MFIKPFRVKSKTQLKTSEKKKLKAELAKNFPLISEDQLNTAVNIKDELTQMKIETAEGHICTVHLAGKTPIVFTHDDKMYPTLFLLWQAPTILPSFATHAEVLSRLANGADLMLPGIVVDGSLGLRAYGKLAKGTPVSVNTVDNMAPIAVGRTALSSEDMYMAAKKGKGVEILHFLGDQLFQQGGKVARPSLEPPSIGEKPKPEAVEKPSVEEDQNVASYANALAGKLEDVKVAEPAPEEAIENGEEVEDTPEVQLTPQEEMDALLKNCFLKALKTSAKKLELPCLTNLFFANHILPACPKSKSLDIKKSSFKKLSKFLASMQEEGILEVKEQTKGVESIVGIDYGHDMLRAFRDEFVEEAEDEIIDEDDDRYEAPAVTDMYCITAAVLPIFKPSGHEKGTALTAAQVKHMLTDYIKQNNLQHPEQKTVIRLDPLLSDALLEHKEKNESPALTWERLMQRCLNKMTKAYCIRFPGQEPVLKKGELKPIEMTVATRSGNKKVTLVSGLDTFGIDLTEFAHKCQVGVAASTSIVTSPDKKGSQVLVQGNQVAFVTKLLFEEYKLQRKYVKGAEGAVAKPKPRKK